MQFFIAILVYTLLNVYVGWNGVQALRQIGFAPNPYIYWVGFLVIVYSYLFGRWKPIFGPLRRLLKVVGSYYFAVMEFCVLLLPFADIAVWLGKLAGYAPSVTIPIVSGGVIIILLLLFGMGIRNAYSPVIRTYEVEIEKRVADMKQLNVVMLSDLHLGNTMGRRHLKRLLTRVNGLHPDLILMPGDIIDDDIEPFSRNHMGELLGQLKAKYGVYATLGNHEYYGHHIEEYARQMKEIGIRVLQDESVTIANAIHIIGRKDKTAESPSFGGRLKVAQLVEKLDLDRPMILMDHQPAPLQPAVEAGIDLQLSGHTHHGQFFPNNLITKRLFEVDWGYLRKDQMHVIVSSGYGAWGPPIRLASRSEVVHITVQFQT